jgi:hypothetical protein
MPAVANDIAKVCGGQLTAVVATHRHADHISGFATEDATGRSGVTIKGLAPRLVLQPWTEDPDAARDARTATTSSSRSRKSFTAGLAAMHEIAGGICRLTAHPPAWMGPELRQELAFLGQDNLKNESAVKNLIAMGNATGARPVFAHHGSRSGLESLLPGVKVRVLGPPDLTQTEKIRKMRKTDPDQFWHFVAGGPLPRARSGRGRKRGRRRSSGGVPAVARWFRDRLESLQGEQLLQIVRTLDDQMNNTSLILLFEVFGKKLLFPGDAQIENWSYALQDAPVQPGRAARGRGRLQGRSSRQPQRDAQGAALGEPRRGASPEGSAPYASLDSSRKHGRRRKPGSRRTLLEALRRETLLQNTHDLKFGKEPELCQKLVVTP